MSEHLILVGLPGAGKTTVGRLLAAEWGRQFLDFDEEIEKRTGLSVSRLFAERGESGFRQLERELTEELCTAPDHVLAPGGGWMAVPGLSALLRPPSTVVYLCVSPEEALRRLGSAVSTRPLLSGPSPLDEMRRLYALRHSIYAGADVVLNVERNDTQGVMKLLRNLASPRGPA